MADPKRVDTSSAGLGSIGDILTLLDGGKSKSTTTSDTSALQSILGQLQGTDYGDVLKSTFTQAGGQIPGLTASLANSLGARTGNNSSVATALGKLLESTAIKGAGQVSQLQQNNQQMQLQAANGIAGGNKTTTTQSAGSNAAKVLAGLQLGGKFLDSSTGKSLLGKGKSALDSMFGGDSATPALTPGADAGDFASLDSSSFGSGGDAGVNLFADQANNFAGDLGGSLFDSGAGSAGDAAGDVIGGNDFSLPTEDFFSFADGGLVGRDQKPVKLGDDGDAEDDPLDPNWEMDDGEFPKSFPTKNPSGEGSQAYADGGRVEPKIGTKGPVKSGGTGGGLSKESTQAAVSSPSQAASGPKFTLTFEPGTIPKVEKGLKDAGAYADGGSVRVGGGRVSSRPTYATDAITKSGAIQSPLEALNPGFNLGRLQMPFNSETGEGVGGSSASAASGTGTAESAAVGNAIGNAVGNAVMSAVVGPVAMSAMNAIGINTPQSAISQALAALGIGTSSVNPDGTSSTSPTATGTSSVADAANADSDDGDGGTSGGSAGGVGGDGTGGGGGGDGGTGGGGVADGGHIKGKGTGTSDSISAKLSTGEYVIPADVVQSLGVRFFDELKNNFHTPAAEQNAR